MSGVVWPLTPAASKGLGFAVLAATALLGGCGSDDGLRNGSDAAVETGFLAGAQLQAFPDSLSETGLYPDTADRGAWSPLVSLFEPAHALWTNGSDKQRFVSLPVGATVDTSQQDWVFPVGVIFFKTFSYRALNSDSLPIETRALRLTEDGWEYAVYLWDDEGMEAELLDGSIPVKVAVNHQGEEFEHEVPSTLQCRMCHESQEPRVIGFDELRLNAPLSGDTASVDAVTQLVQLAEDGILSELPVAPDEIVHEDQVTESVLGYFQGNCVHCHNGSFGAASAFDLDHSVALGNIIGVETTSELVSGIRVTPGIPDESGLFLAVSRNSADTTAQPMPPIGVQRVDEVAVDMIRRWILALP